MVIWKGLGIAIPLFWALCTWIFVDLIEWTHRGYMLAMFPTAIFSFFVGARLNAERDYEESHTLFFIPMQYWGAICIVIGIVGLILGWD